MSKPEPPLYPPSDRRSEILKSAEFQSLLQITVGLLLNKNSTESLEELVGDAERIQEILIKRIDLEE